MNENENKYKGNRMNNSRRLPQSEFYWYTHEMNSIQKYEKKPEKDS